MPRLWNHLNCLRFHFDVWDTCIPQTWLLPGVVILWVCSVHWFFNVWNSFVVWDEFVITCLLVWTSFPVFSFIIQTVAYHTLAPWGSGLEQILLIPLCVVRGDYMGLRQKKPRFCVTTFYYLLIVFILMSHHTEIIYTSLPSYYIKLHSTTPKYFTIYEQVASICVDVPIFTLLKPC
jgi:hypothetical protein